jgi:catechol 2,3-dioxygenase-like lactoylglutathione lyase family enzyme
VLDHVRVNVRDVATARAFYAAALEPLGVVAVMEFPGPDRATVDAFHKAALAAGGRDNGAPGMRAYREHYYGAFVLDPDGNNIEAVCHLPDA